MLSVIILTKNEEDRIVACLESVKWADEIIVCDSESRDRTVEIVKKYTGKYFPFKISDFSQIRNQGASKASGDWILFVDADERVSIDLKHEIQNIILEDKYSAFAISRRNIIFGSEQKYGPFWPDWVIRLLKKKEFETWVGKVHEYPKFRGKLGYLKNSLIHLTHRNLDQVITKSLEWSKIDAALRFDSGHPKMNGLRFLRIFISEIFNQGIKRKGFFNGTIGIIDSLLQVFSMFMTYVRLWQMQQKKPIDQIYDDLDKELIEKNFKL